MASSQGQDPIFAGTFTLIFSGATLIESHYVQSMRTQFRRLTQIQRRQNFWATSIILDGRYPAQLWEHEFTVYTEVNSNPIQYAHRFFDVETQISSTPFQLVLQESLTDRIDFGNCYLERASLDRPKELLLYRAGFMKIRFLGSTLPNTL